MPPTGAWYFAEVLNFFGNLSHLNGWSKNVCEDDKVEERKAKPKAVTQDTDSPAKELMC